VVWGDLPPGIGRQDQMAFHGSLPRSHAAGIDRSNIVRYKENADDKSDEEKVDTGQLKLQGVRPWVSLPVSGFEGSARRSSHPGRRARAGIAGGPGRATRDGRGDQGGTTVGAAGGGDTHGAGPGEATARAAIRNHGRPRAAEALRPGRKGSGWGDRPG
jgi:hypothetical protein